VYSRGRTRLFYQSNIDIAQTVTAKIINPELETKGPLSMTFVSDGLYYMDVWFTKIGSYVFYVYENGVRKHKDILVVGDSLRYIIYPDEEYLI